MWISDPDVTAAGLNEAPLPEILQHDVDRFTREPHQITEIGLVESDGNQHPLIVPDAIILSEIEQRVGHARVRALAEQFLDARMKPAKPQTHDLRDLIAERRRLFCDSQQQVSTERAQDDIFVRRRDVIAR